MVFDGANLLNPLTVEQNLVYAQRLIGHRRGLSIAEALGRSGMQDFARRRVARLSLGERKRVAVARALLGAPELIVLDEPLSALDPLGVESMLELIRELAGAGTTLVVSSHRLHEMERVITHAGILSRGRLAASGTLEELVGGKGQRCRFEVTPLERARGICEGLAGVKCLAPENGDLAGLRVELIGTGPAELNRALVLGECEVTAIVPERADLAGRFAALVGEGSA